MFHSTKSFACRVYNLYVEIIKQIQTSNEQYKFQARLYYHDVLNIEDYFMIQIRLESCPLRMSHKLQSSSVKPFKVLQMIESNNHVFKLPLKFDISSTFNMNDLVIYITQQSFRGGPFETFAILSLYLEKNKHINSTLDVQIVFTRDNEPQ